ncbi:MAG: alpha/beta hydrolase [Flavicella sp.]|nr:alpha/beta hydrolase [Flavicella sp.]
MVQFGFLSSQENLISIWGDIIPNSQKSDEKEIYPKAKSGIFKIAQIQVPTLEVFEPSEPNKNGKSVIICPGGGYHSVAYDWEGTDVAKWFNSIGVTAFVLKYRMPNSASVKISHEAPLQDAQRALRYVRSNAEEFGIEKNKIGIMGFSAGGHLASTLGTQFDKPNNFKESDLDLVSARPDFMILLYPVVTMKEDFTHAGSRNSLLGPKPKNKLINQFSNELQVSVNTPPTFIVHASDDKAVPVENSLQLYKSLNDHNIKTEMHIYPYGGHGFGMAINRGRLQTWTNRLEDWLVDLD